MHLIKCFASAQEEKKGPQPLWCKPWSHSSSPDKLLPHSCHFHPPVWPTSLTYFLPFVLPSPPLAHLRAPFWLWHQKLTEFDWCLSSGWKMNTAFFLSKNEVKVKMNVCRRNVCSAEIPLSLLAGREKHHDNHSQRLKHQLAAANEASLASAIFPTISLSCSPFFSSLFFSHLYQLRSTSKIQIRQTVIKRMCSDWQWAASQPGLVYFKIGKSQKTRVIVVALPLDCFAFFSFFWKTKQKKKDKLDIYTSLKIE